MPADVVKTSQNSVDSSHEHQRLTDELGGEEVTWIRDLCGVAYDLPRAREDFLFLRSPDIVRCVEVGRKRPGSSDI